MLRRTCAVVILALIELCLATPSRAVFHLTVIDEVLTSYGGDPNVQFVEMRMLAGFQSFVGHSVLAAFDTNGAYVGDILEVPANVANAGNGTRWLIGTAAFQTATGLAPDFIMPTGILRSGGGMVCFGGGGGLSPQNPPSWDRTDIANYVDCLAYGSYVGPSNARIGTPTTLTGDGHSLQRTGSTHDNAADFACADPATPKNNSGATASMPATDPCVSAATPTPMTTPTTTPTTTPIPTATATASPVSCVGDCNGDNKLAINELILCVNIALGLQPDSACRACSACLRGPGPIIACLIKAVNNALSGCSAA